MSKIKINVRPYKGEYPFDIDEQALTAIEWRWIKQISGYLPATLGTGWDGRDPDLFIAFAIVAMHRAGKVSRDDIMIAAETLSEAPFDGAAIQITEDDDVGLADKDDAVPPPVPPSELPTRSTGTSGRQSSDHPDSIPAPTGHPDSDRSATYVRPISLT